MGRNNSHRGSGGGGGGRGHGRSNNRGGSNRRQQGKGSNSSPNNKPKGPPQLQYKFTLKQLKDSCHPFNTVLEHICTYMQKNYTFGNDIAQSLRDQRVIDLTRYEPSLRLAVHPDLAEEARLAHQYSLEYST